MSVIYEFIRDNLNFTKEEKGVLRNFFMNNPNIRAEAELIFKTCDEEEKFTCLKDLLKPPGKRSISPSAESSESKKGKPIDEELSNICELVQHLKTSKGKAIYIDDDDIISGSSVDKDPLNIIRHPEDKPLAVIDKPAIYVRESYEDLYHLMIRLASKGSDHKFLVTGTSGIGKSCFLIYFLIQLLCEYEDVLIIFQSHRNKEVFYCFENLNLRSGNYYDFSTYLKSSETWYLADGIISPSLVSAKTIIALSPKGAAKDEFQEIYKDIVKIFNMSPWTLNELSFCRKYVFPEVPEDIMQDLYYKAGGVPRYVFRRVKNSLQHYPEPKTPEERETIINEAFERVKYALLQVKDFGDLVSCFTENAYFVQYSSRLIHRWSDSSFTRYHLHWASRYIYDEIEKKLEKQSWSSLLGKIQTMKDYPSARGIMFEMYVIHLFRSSNDHFVMRELLENPKATDPKHKKFSTNKSNKLAETVNIRTATELSSKSDNCIILPDTSNFGAADLFYTPDMVFQVTVSKDHPIKQAELVRIVENMPAYRKNEPVYLVFVVPDDIYENYKYQDIVTKDPTTKSFRRVITKDKRLKNVQQWVLKIDISASMSTVFVKAKDTIMQSLKFGASSGSSSSLPIVGASPSEI